MATDWHPEDIKAALRKRYGTVFSLATAWGYSHAALSRAIHNVGISAPIELRIASALDKRPHEIWPSRWSPKGLPYRLIEGGPRGKRAAKSGRRRPNTQRENGAAS